MEKNNFNLTFSQGFPLEDYSGLTLNQRIYLFFKRFFDIVISLMILILCFPILILSAVFIKISSKGPVIFSQERIGKNGKKINVYKFRTMMLQAPKNVAKHEFKNSEAYITKVGKLLRLTSVDELPQIFNVLKGDMSLIGPRPLIPEEKEAHELRMKNGVYSIKPGITGLAQVNGRDILNIEDKVRFDTEYLHFISLKMDVYIFLKSLLVVFCY